MKAVLIASIIFSIFFTIPIIFSDAEGASVSSQIPYYSEFNKYVILPDLTEIAKSDCNTSEKSTVGWNTPMSASQECTGWSKYIDGVYKTEGTYFAYVITEVKLKNSNMIYDDFFYRIIYLHPNYGQNGLIIKQIYENKNEHEERSMLKIIEAHKSQIHVSSKGKISHLDKISSSDHDTSFLISKFYDRQKSKADNISKNDRTDTMLNPFSKKNINTYFTDNKTPFQPYKPSNYYNMRQSNAPPLQYIPGQSIPSAPSIPSSSQYISGQSIPSAPSIPDMNQQWISPPRMDFNNYAQARTNWLSSGGSDFSPPPHPSQFYQR